MYHLFQNFYKYWKCPVNSSILFLMRHVIYTWPTFKKMEDYDIAFVFNVHHQRRVITQLFLLTLLVVCIFKLDKRNIIIG